MRTIYLEGESNGGVYRGNHFERFGKNDLKWTFKIYSDTSYPRTPVLAIYCNEDRITGFSFGKRQIKQLLKILEQ